MNIETIKLDDYSFKEVTYFPKTKQPQMEVYYFNGKEHHPTEPAITEYYESGQVKSKIYYFNGKKHRINGPAALWYDFNGKLEYKEYYVRDLPILHTE